MQRNVAAPIAGVTVSTRSGSEQAYQVLHWGYTALPVIAGADKFTDLLGNWDSYLAQPIARVLPISVHGFMMIVGVVEIVAGLVVALRPKIGAYVVAAWLAGIILNLIIGMHALDVALRDFGLALGALALARLAADHVSAGTSRSARST